MPDDILNNWTEERFGLYFQKRNERVRASAEASKPESQRTRTPVRISDHEMFASMGVKVGVV